MAESAVDTQKTNVDTGGRPRERDTQTDHKEKMGFGCIIFGDRALSVCVRERGACVCAHGWVLGSLAPSPGSTQEHTEDILLH